MTAIVTPPFPVFVDADGLPLEGGFIYIGVANLDPVSNPLAVFWDSALTVPAAQPLRTEAGVIVRNGAPAAVYVGADYSIAVHDSNNEQISTVEVASGLPATAGSITLASGESLTAQAGASIDLEDGATMTVGDATGVGVLVTVASNARIVGSLIPNVDDTNDLGASNRRWGAIYSTSLTTDVVQVDTSVIPVTGGTEVIGTNAVPFDTVVSQSVRAKDVATYSTTAPASSADLVKRTALTSILATCVQTSTTATPALAAEANYNVASVTRNSAGNYTITFSHAIGSSGVRAGFVVCRDDGFHAAVNCGTTSANVIIRDGSGHTLTDSAFNFFALGNPNVTDPIA
jgi:hypothetical protein